VIFFKEIVILIVLKLFARLIYLLFKNVITKFCIQKSIDNDKKINIELCASPLTLFCIHSNDFNFCLKQKNQETFFYFYIVLS